MSPKLSKKNWDPPSRFRILIPLTHSQHDEEATLNTRSRRNKHATLNNNNRTNPDSHIHSFHQLSPKSKIHALWSTLCAAAYTFSSSDYSLLPSFHSPCTTPFIFGLVRSTKKKKKSHPLLLFLRKSLFC